MPTSSLIRQTLSLQYSGRDKWRFYFRQAAFDMFGFLCMAVVRHIDYQVSWPFKVVFVSESTTLGHSSYYRDHTSYYAL